MVAIRDLKCSQDIAEMAALGKFEEEFIVYGCCYVENGQVYYRVSTQEDELYLFIEQCMERGVYPSPVQRLLNRTLVPSGMQEEYLYQTKIMLAKQMQKNYPSALLKQFAVSAEQDDNDAAAAILYCIKKEFIDAGNYPLCISAKKTDTTNLSGVSTMGGIFIQPDGR